MADKLSVDVGGLAFDRYPRLPETARAKLRSTIPFLTKQLADRVRSKLAPGALFKTTDRILPAVKSEMVETNTSIQGRVYIDSGMFPNVVAHTLESGSKAHDIEAVNASALFFFWEKLGVNVAFKKVHHPGFAGRSYMQSSLDELRDELIGEVRDAVIDGLRQ